MVANLTQILNFKVNFHQEFEQFSKNKIYANNGGHLHMELDCFINYHNSKRSDHLDVIVLFQIDILVTGLVRHN